MADAAEVFAGITRRAGTCATRRSCRTSLALAARATPTSTRSPSSPPPPRRSAGATSTSRSPTRCDAYRRRLRPRGARRTARPRLPLDRVRLSVRRRGRSRDRRRDLPPSCSTWASTRSRSATPSASPIPARSPQVLDAVTRARTVQRRRPAPARHARHGARQRLRRAPGRRHRRSMPRPAASAAARTRPARPATWRPRICFTCSTACGIDTGVSLDAALAASRHRSQSAPSAIACLPGPPRPASSARRARPRGSAV